ncbi:MAG: amino acid adenylation domain-containing protein [Ignavibacteriales bacterium]
MVNKVSFYPLTHAQKGIWYMEQFYPGTGINNILGMVILFDDIDFSIFEKSINFLLKNNDSPRLRIVINGDEPQQYLAKYRFRKIEVLDHFASLDELNGWLDEYAAQPMEVLDSDLMEFLMVKTADGNVGICCKAHHLVADAWTMALVVKQMVDVYYQLLRGRKDYEPWPSFSEHIEAAKQYLLSSKFESARQYWKNKFASLPELRALKLTPSNMHNVQANRKSFILTAEINTLIEKYCQASGISGYIFFLSVTALLIRKISGKSDIVIGAPVLNRPTIKDKLTMGMFIDTIPVRLEIDDDITWGDFVQYVKREWEEIRDQKCPYDLILDDIRDQHKVQELLYDVSLSYQKIKFDIEHEYVTYWYNNGFQTNSLVINVSDRNKLGRAVFEIDYHIETYSEDEIDSYMEYLQTIMEDAINNPNKPLYDIDIIPLHERKRVLLDFNNTEHTYPKDNTLGLLIQEQVKKSPNSTAVVFEDQVLTYDELNKRVNKLARFLRSKGVGPEVIVGVLLERSPSLIIGILAIIKAGGAYMPLDPDYPAERLDFMLNDCGSKLVLTQSNLIYKIKFSGLVIDILDENSFDDNDNNLENINNSTNLVYVYYTSGSTGQPKGAMIEHKSLTNFIYGISNMINFGPGAIVASVGTISFDIFVFETMPTLVFGGTLVLVSEEDQINYVRLAKRLVDQNATTLLTTPSRIRLLTSDPECHTCLRSLKEIMVGGDVFSDQLFHELRFLTKAEIINCYGPTETTVAVTAGILHDDEKITIGKPISNTRIYVLDKYNKLQPIGGIGELCVSGEGLARGYINRSEATALNFVPNPYETGNLMYRTGDLARWLPEGNLEYLGRVDNQVKIGGFRIELGEVENTLSKHPSIKEAVVVVDNDIDGNKILSAYLTLKEDVSATELRDYLSEALPHFMIPAYFVKLDKFPLTASGKVDRKMLGPYDKGLLINEWIPPRNDTERVLASLWAEVLRVNRIGIKDNFFSMGGDSLKVLRALTKTLPYDWNLTARDFYSYPTIEKLAHKIHGNLAEQMVLSTDTIFQRKNIEPLTEINISGKRAEFKSVLLTGATGFLGAHLLNELITTSEVTIYCLVRRKDSKGAKARLLEVLETYFPGQTRNLFMRRVFIVDGDIADRNLGLTNKQYMKLGKTVDTVIHAAAIVKHLGHWEDFRITNVLGTMNVVEFCAQFQIQLNHISTTGVAGQYLVDYPVTNTDFTENDFYIGQDYTANVYVRSKFEAENIIFKAIESGLDVNIFRVGMLTGRYSDGRFQINITENGFYNRLKAIIAIGTVPKSLMDQFVELTPVDMCAQAIIRLIMTPEIHGQVFHIANSRVIRLSDLLSVFEAKGYKVESVNYDTFLAQIKNLANEPEGEDDLMWLMQYISFVSEEALTASSINLKSNFTEDCLRQVGFSWPQIDTDYLNKIIGHMIKKNYLSHKNLVNK